MFKLIKLGLQRQKSPKQYRELQEYVAQASVGELQARGIHFAESCVLELGAGYGGYAFVLNRQARRLIATDFRSDEFFARMNIPFCVADLSRPFPFVKNCFDLIYCSSLIEHLAEPDKLLAEAWRVLKPGGYLYLSFPPFYSLAMMGGHNFKPFHFLGERLAISIVNWLYGTHFRDYATCYGSWGLYPLKIDDVKQLILDGHFEISSIYTRLSGLNTTKLPGILKDLATWHVCYLAQKLPS
ncbi:MAG: methyltransferase domain-containing protein [Anaerolineae bacterium]|nr:methyltransferase domain-containing protein [Anaerolineae bacterium]